MKKFIPKLIKILEKYNTSGLSTSFYIDGTYVVIVKIFKKEDDSIHEPKFRVEILGENELDYRYSVTIVNLLTFKSQTLYLLPLTSNNEILPGLSEKILKQVEEIIIWITDKDKTQSVTEKDFRAWEEAQDNIMDNYVELFNLNAQEEKELHMFFSPGRVVAGLNEDQIQTCIRMYPFRKEQSLRYPLLYIPMLHETLMIEIDNPKPSIPRSIGLMNAIQKIFDDLEKPVYQQKLLES